MGATGREHSADSAAEVPNQSASIEVDKLSLLTLLARVPVGQLWAFVGVIVGLVFGAFAIAWSIRGIVDDANVRSVETRNDELERSIKAKEEGLAEAEEEVRELNEKDRFLSLYLRYMMARSEIDTSIPVENARRALDEYIRQRVDRERLIIRKGGGRLATLEFPDKTVWTLPRELHMVEER